MNTMISEAHLPANHISYEMEKSIQQMIKPLEKLGGIQYFCYGVNYADTSGFTLHTNSNYYESWFKHEGTLRGFYLKDGWHSYDHLLPDTLLKQAHSQDIGNFLTHIEHANDKTFIFEFGTRPDDPNAFDFYLNHLNLLKRFCQYFIEHTPKETLLRAEKERFIPHEHMRTTHKKGLDESIFNNSDLVSKPFEILNASEKAYLNFILQGYSNNEIGEELNISPKTVFKHIAKIKKKLDCDKKSSLFAKARQEGALAFNFNIPMYENSRLFDITDENLFSFLVDLYAPLSKLSHQEFRCLQLLLHGYTLQEISSKLGIQIPTVADYIWRMKNKLSCPNKIDLFKQAMKFGLIEISSELVTSN